MNTVAKQGTLLTFTWDDETSYYTSTSKKVVVIKDFNLKKELGGRGANEGFVCHDPDGKIIYERWINDGLIVPVLDERLSLFTDGGRCSLTTERTVKVEWDIDP
jgi:hypothetical protein